MMREFGGASFENLGEIIPRRNHRGELVEYVPDPPAPGDRPRHAHAAGPFGKFTVPNAPRVAGVFAISEDDEVRYVGTTSDIARLAGSLGFGSVTKGKLVAPGPATNCRINHLLLETARSGHRLELWLCRMDDPNHRLVLRERLKAELSPAWNAGGDIETIAPRPQDASADATELQGEPSSLDETEPVPEDSAPQPASDHEVRPVRAADIGFRFVGPIGPVRDEAGQIVEDRPHLRFANEKGLSLVNHGAGPFCKFTVPQADTSGGIYAIVSDGGVVYIGKCENLAARYGSAGYGAIQPRNCFAGGQSTNCRINHFILCETKTGKAIELWFITVEQADLRADLEAAFIRHVRPPWNRQLM